MLQIKNLSVKVWEKEVLSCINMTFEIWKNYLLLGKNGSGKSSLVHFLMGNPKYEYISGEVIFDEKNLLEMTVDQRSKEWLFLSFQNVPEIGGVNVSEYLRIIYNASLSTQNLQIAPLTPFVFKRFIKKYLSELNISEDFLSRDLNVGFSWWEKRKMELLQARILQPKYIILDEIDSGLDIDAFKTVASLIGTLRNEKNSIIVITHHFDISNYLDIQEVYVLKSGRVERKGTLELLKGIEQNGFE